MSTTDLSRLMTRDTANTTYELPKFNNLYQRAYESSIFSPANNESIRLRLVVHPRGMSNCWDESHVMAYLWVDQADRDVLAAKCRISIVDTKGERHNSQEGYVEFALAGKKENHRMRQSWQYLLSRQYLTDNATELLQGDKLTLSCEVEILDQLQQTPPNYDQEKQSKASDDMQALLDSGKFSDVKLVVGGKEFPAHKAILSARSSVFQAMFDQPPKESQDNRIEITDIEGEVFQELLRYIYTLRTPALERFDAQLLATADKYKLDCLKSICEQSLRCKLSIETAAEVLLLADVHNAANLKLRCIEYITDHAAQVMATESWKVMTSSRPELAVLLFQNFVGKHSVNTSADAASKTFKK